MTPPSVPKLTQPLRDLAAWTAHFCAAEIPVLAETAEALEALRINEDEVDANSLGETLAHDPLMTLKVLAHVATHRSQRCVTDVETVISALVLMGISPFFREFGTQPTVEDHLGGEPEAMQGLADTLRRAHRGANFALSFAVHRMDHDAAIIHTAALLHDFSEMLLWCHAPALALRIRAAQQSDPALRSAAAQHAVLGIELADLQQALMKAWRLPELLVSINDDRHPDHAKVRCVTLALRLARHSANGWDNPALPDDIDEIADLLNLSTQATLNLVREA
ncbi:MAG: HDOD domain-containing protein [Pseudomonadota bacterium]|nr:HDOD domain-containing protein [Pseudomonadota bacterium]